jgi:SAM-dependent MidA family methyltransferase
MDELVEKIESEIRNHGAISFARFMELALYCPVYGYYEKEGDNLGKHGDYYTSASVGSLFGEMLGLQFARWFEEDLDSKIGQEKKTNRTPGGTPQFLIIEAGAHNGHLAWDILAWMREQRRLLFPQIQYWIVEPSDRRRQWQRKTLGEFMNKVHWTPGLHEFGLTNGEFNTGVTSASSPCSKIIFSNELFDAMPVHRVGWSATERTWFEWGVSLRNGEFVWERMADNQQGKAAESNRAWAALSRLLEALRLPNAAPQTANPETGVVPDHGSALLEVLPDGFTVELCPAAEEWWSEAANVISGSDKLVAIDYGRTATELFMPERKQGTLRAYRRHQLSPDVLADPGGQDITADVNFTALEQAGKRAGLTTEVFTSQESFLTEIAGRIWKGEDVFGEWTSERTREFQTLTHPEHLGRAFKFLVQSRKR